uniref:Uncharacterized protein n=1 Tax=Siphoviridae sp. ctJT77 TaxID=2825432 RepID=A0A8S5UZI9_9CAUD|nr:MAG TPA: hypothetical protein [Siphoviridae sp. ctJT77]
MDLKEKIRVRQNDLLDLLESFVNACKVSEKRRLRE